METKANYVAVGAFVLSGFLGLIIAALWLAGTQYSQRGAHYEIFFTGSVTGLGDGTPVRYNGINVGRVTALKFDPQNPKQVIAFLEVVPTLHLRADSVATIATMGLTGGAYVEIEGGTKDSPILTADPENEYPVIPSKPSTLQELANSAPGLIAKLNRISDALESVLDHQNRTALRRILHNTDVLSSALATRSSALATTIDNLQGASSRLNDNLKTLQVTLNHADKAVIAIRQLSQNANRMVGGNTSQELDELLAQTRTTMANLNHLALRLQAEPSSLIFGNRRKGYVPR
jgi:phospholipid/cholesterol/gamma-HCH transport system substrate-binding protein